TQITRTPVGLSEEQKVRIKESRERAMQRRRVAGAIKKWENDNVVRLQTPTHLHTSSSSANTSTQRVQRPPHGMRRNSLSFPISSFPHSRSSFSSPASFHSSTSVTPSNT